MQQKFLNNKTILITGGTGSFGKSFLSFVIKNNIRVKKLIIFSRDEFKQFNLEKELSEKHLAFVRFFLGDIRDKERLRTAFKDVDIVIHAAALKQVPSAEYNPIEYIKTNINGAQNIIEASIESNVKKVIALSTDKAAAPINLYGATKLCSDKLFVAANNITGKQKISFSVVRYGNVMGSRGSVIPFFLSKSKNKYLPITDINMTRFNITMDEAINMVNWSLRNLKGGEILIPKIPSYRILDLAKAINSKAKIKIIGKRQGEKIHEDLITKTDAQDTYQLKNYYIIISDSIKNKFYNKAKLKKVKSDFFYNSGSNKRFLDIKELKNLINKI